MSLARIPIFVWFLVPTIVVIGVGTWFFTTKFASSEQEAENAPVAVSRKVEGVEEFSIVGREHIPEGTKGTGYNSDPPTSGVHWPAPAKNGVHNDPMPDERLIHNLEHGHVWIAYKSDVGDEVKNKLVEIVNDDDWKVIMVPRSQNDKQIILVAWGRYLKMETPDYDKIKEFIKSYRNRGPEDTPE